MFEKCNKIDKVCGFCCVSTYNPDIFKHDDVKKEFGLDQDVDISKLKDSDFEFQKLPGTETVVIKDKKGKIIKTVEGRGEAFAKYRKVIPIKKI